MDREERYQVGEDRPNSDSSGERKGFTIYEVARDLGKCYLYSAGIGIGLASLAIGADKLLEKILN